MFLHDLLLSLLLNLLSSLLFDPIFFFTPLVQTYKSPVGASIIISEISKDQHDLFGR